MIDISALSPGAYTALLIADCENDDIFGTNIELVISASESVFPKPAQPAKANQDDVQN
jgi:hypothetical protein